ncbi:MAG: energy transducer TonB [Nitrospirae bacterium]|nr:energy transducer TonB [Nitrospirota bacterium]
MYDLLDSEGPVKNVIDDFMAEEGCILTETGYRYDDGPDSFSCPRIDLSELVKLKFIRAGWMYQSISRLVIVRLVELGSANNTFPIMALTICQEKNSEKVSDDNYHTTLATRVCGFDPSRFSLPRPTWSDAGKKSMSGEALQHRLDAMETLKRGLDQQDRGEIPTSSGGTVPPVYPRIARESGWEGTVLIRVNVDADGNASKVKVQKSSGHAVLDEAAVDAVRKWKFSPAKDGNIPIRSVVEIPINFDLRKQ